MSADHGHSHKDGIQVLEGNVFSLFDLIDELQALPPGTPHKDRTRIIADKPEYHIIVSAYEPGQGEEMHIHPTNNVLEVVAGVFHITTREPNGDEKTHVCFTGDIVVLDRGQPHRVFASPGQHKNAIIKVTIIEGMPTTTEGYSTLVE